MGFRAAVPYIVGGAILMGGAFVVLGKKAQARFEEGEAFERKGSLSDAIERYEWALQAYSPFGTYPEKALERLRAIAEEAEVSGATDTAIEAWQSIVSGLAVIENISQPYEKELSKAEMRLADLKKVEPSSKEESP